MPINLQNKAIKTALKMLPPSLMESVPEMIVKAIIERMDAVEHEGGENIAIMIVKDTKDSNDCLIGIEVFDKNGNFDHTAEMFPAKEFIAKLINYTKDGI